MFQQPTSPSKLCKNRKRGHVQLVSLLVKKQSICRIPEENLDVKFVYAAKVDSIRI